MINNDCFIFSSNWQGPIMNVLFICHLFLLNDRRGLDAFLRVMRMFACKKKYFNWKNELRAFTNDVTLLWRYLASGSQPTFQVVSWNTYCVSVNATKGRQRTMRKLWCEKAFVKTNESIWRQNKDYAGGATCWSYNSLNNQCICTILLVLNNQAMTWMAD